MAYFTDQQSHYLSAVGHKWIANYDTTHSPHAVLRILNVYMTQDSRTLSQQIEWSQPEHDSTSMIHIPNTWITAPIYGTYGTTNK